MAYQVRDEELLYNVRVPAGQWRNFSGNPTRFNPAGGKRSFTAFLSEDQAQELGDKGWPIKWTTPREEGDEPRPFMTIKVAFGNFPPEIYMIQGKNKVSITENNVNLLDGADFENVDILIRPYNYVQNGGGVAAYLKSGYFTRRADPLAEKYADMMDEEMPFV